MPRELRPRRFGWKRRESSDRHPHAARLARWMLLALMLGLPACVAGLPRAPRIQTRPAAPPPMPQRPPITAPLGIRMDQALGALPALYRPSAMLTSSADDAKQLLLDVPGRLGAVRWGIGWLLDNVRSEGDYGPALQARSQVLKPFVGKGAQVIVTFEGMPWWLTSRPQTGIAGPYGWATYKASPPRDYTAYENFVFETVRLMAPNAGPGALYEFWNEPNSRSFWAGSKDELFRTYDAFARGARRADPKARIGGLAVGSWDNTREGDPAGSPPLLQSFLIHVRDARVPLDFVSWHAYAFSPEARRDGAPAIRRWLGQAGLPVETQQVVDEWNLWATFPANSDPSRDGVQGAAFLPADLMSMQHTGVALQTICNLQDFSDPPPGQVYTGDFGMITRRPTLKKTPFQTLEMLGRLDGSRVGVDLPDDVVDLEGVGALATTAPGRTTLLVYRYANDPAGSLVRLLDRAGYPNLDDLHISKAAITNYLLGKAPLPPDAPAASRTAVETAVKKVQSGWASTVTLQLAVQGGSPTTRYTLYRIDDDHLNPGGAFYRVRAQGGSLNDAIRAAQAMQSFTPTATGTGAPPDLTFGTYGVALVVLESGAP